jgi:zinc/manganese transport system substrate-binding protein
MRLLTWLLVLASPALALAQPRIVAAEAVYAGMARQIAGPADPVTALIANPAQDPHLFEAGPAAARALTDATIVVYNGAGYDPWMRDLLAATGGGGPRQVISVGGLVRAPRGANPHLWYDPRTMDAAAAALAHALQAADPAHRSDYASRLAAFRATLAPVLGQIAALRARHQGATVAATEPVFGPMLSLLGLRVADADFQLAIENDTEPSAASLAALEQALRTRSVQALLVNRQTRTDLTDHLTTLAHRSGLGVVAVSETEPPDQTYAAWVGAELGALGQALDAAK